MTEEKMPLGELLYKHDESTWDGYDKHDWDRDSLAVVACDGKGHGAVLWTVGPALRMEIEEIGNYALNELWLDDAPLGLSVWVGHMVWQRGGFEYPDDGEAVPCSSNHFRPLTDAEWEVVKAGKSPWDDAAWRKECS